MAGTGNKSQKGQRDFQLVKLAEVAAAAVVPVPAGIKITHAVMAAVEAYY